MIFRKSNRPLQSVGPDGSMAVARSGTYLVAQIGTGICCNHTVEAICKYVYRVEIIASLTLTKKIKEGDIQMKFEEK